MIRSVRYFISFMLVIALCFQAGIVIAQETKTGKNIGYIIVGSGHLIARTADGDERVLRRREPVFKGDTILVSDNSFVQIRFTDGGLVSLRPGSEFTIENYNFKGKEDGDEKVIFNLLKGGLHTVTGRISKRNKANYQLKTPIATIGIRGTYYGLRICISNCGSRPNGLYGGVIEGGIMVSNTAGKGIFGPQQFFFVEPNMKPKKLPQAPGIIFDFLNSGPDSGLDSDLDPDLFPGLGPLPPPEPLVPKSVIQAPSFTPG